MKPATRRLSLCTVVLLLVASNSWSMEPPRPGEIAALRASGELAARLEFARSIGNHRIDPYLVQRHVQALTGEALPAPPPWRQGMPTTGNVKILAILIAFDDYGFTNSAISIDSELFGTGIPANFPYESLANYYDRSSYYQLDLSSGNTLGWYTTAYSRSSVVQTTTGREDLIKEVLNYYDVVGHNFAQYDNDGDGDVDYFVVIWTGPDNGWGGFWWGYQTSFTDSTYTLDSKTLSKYSWQWESRPPGGDFNPVVVIHETGHALGLPDYYDYNGSVGPDGGVGDLDMMDGNAGDHNCFSKWMLDWLTPSFVGTVGSQVIALDSSGTSQDAVMIMPGADSSKLFSEYFMVQNRNKTGNDDQPFPSGGDGMLIWHVDARLSAGVTFMYDNSYTEHKLLRLIEADGLEEIEAGGFADAGDYFLPGDSFDAASTPNSYTYTGETSGVSVSAFSAPGASMSATFTISQTAPPTGVTASDGTYSNRVAVAWNPVAGATHYRVYRHTGNDFTSASAVSSWQTGVSLNDWSVTPSVFYRYWVKAASSAAGANASAFSHPDTGYAGAAPSSLTTLYAANNGASGNTFDVEVLGSTPLEILGLGVNLAYPDNPNRIDVYYRCGTANGFEDSPDGWILLGSDDNVMSNGVDVPSFVHVGGLTLEPGRVYGFYVHLASQGNYLMYTNGGPTTFSNADLSITTYHGKGYPAFFGGSFYLRQWNGTIYYAAGSSPKPTLTASAVDPSAGEPSDPGTFRISRTGTCSPLTVYFSMSGGADNGIDYSTISSPTTISADSLFRNITLSPIDDSDPEGIEPVILSLTANANYYIGSPSSATVNISDDELTTCDLQVLDSASVAGSLLFEACKKVQAGPDTVVESGGDLLLCAGETVAFYDGFSVLGGGELKVIVCGQDLCVVGPAASPLDPACHSCVKAVCAVDSWCCNNDWDGICVGRVASECGLTCP